MCSEFMENHQGDLTDMLRGYAGDWQFVTNTVNHPPDPPQEFGDPFIQLRDPLLQDIDAPMFPSIEPTSSSGVGAEVFGGVVSDVGHQSKFFEHEEMKSRPSSNNNNNNNIFSRMLQIAPTAKLQLPPRESVLAGIAAADSRLIVSPHRNKGNGLVENPAVGVQISSPRNTGIKRRKSQAKKVVCIPAPAPANSRPSGEVVPSDLWAWRKYGQKPIKGSPYPRGYYRCSSSKGCSARKQVERSRTDPNMLVITYTSEHNHPWPTQRNALAGSTRTHQPTKSNSSKNQQKQPNPKEETKEPDSKNPTTDPISTMVKQEQDKDFDMHDDLGFRQSYKPVFLDTSNQPEDNFFADLGEIEPDPLDLLFTEGFSGGDDPDNKDLDPFTFYDWAGTQGASATTSSGATTAPCGEAKKDP